MVGIIFPEDLHDSLVARIRFLDEHGAEVAYVSAGRLYISDAEITNRLRVSNYAWQKMQDGSLALTFDS